MAVLGVTLGLAASGGAIQEATAPSTPDPPFEVDVDLDIDLDIIDVGGEVVQIGRGYTLPAGKRVESAVVIAGTARIEGEIEQDLVVVAGAATLAGTARVGGDVVVVAGTGDVQPGTVVGGDLVAVGSGLNVPPGFAPGGDLVSVGAFAWGDQVANAAPWLTRGLLWGRPIVPELPWIWAVLAVFALLCLLINLVFDGPVRGCTQHPCPKTPDHGAGGISDTSPDRAGVADTDPVGGWTGAGAVPVVRSPDRRPHRQRGCGSLDRKPGPVRGVAAQPAAGGPVAGDRSGGHHPGLHGTGRRSHRLGPGGPSGPGSGRNHAGCRLEAGESTLPQAPTPSPQTDDSGSDTSAGGAAGALQQQKRRQPASRSPSGRPLILSAGHLSPPAGSPAARPLPGDRAITLAFSDGHLGRSFVLLLVYRVALWSWKGTTVGGIICRLRVVRMDGKPLAFTDSLVRGLASILSAAAAGLGWLWILWDPERQAWHDKIAGTLVVRVPTGWPL